VRTVTIGEKAENSVVILQGLNGGEKVIVEGMQKVRPGSEVKPTTGNQQQATAQADQNSPKR
jgi:membrane fusion protein (multidrug efflux system)